MRANGCVQTDACKRQRGGCKRMRACGCVQTNACKQLHANARMHTYVYVCVRAAACTRMRAF
eukprot:5258724-Pleurochrysis_carterae.AAC.1